MKFVVSEKCEILHYRLQSNLLMKAIHHISETEVCSVIFFLGKICVVCDTEKWIFFLRKQQTLKLSFFSFIQK